MLDGWVFGPGCSKSEPVPSPVVSEGSHIVALVEMWKMLEFDIVSEQGHHSSHHPLALEFSHSAAVSPQD